jgi:hypothetical protein
VTTLAITLPLTNVSPLYIPRRDLVLSSADSLTLAVTVLTTDDTDAAAIHVVEDGWALRMAVWRDASGAHSWWGWDYGHPCFDKRELLWTGDGVPTAVFGQFSILIPPATMHDWPRRCGFSIALTSFDGGEIDTLCRGTLQVRRAVDGGVAVGIGTIVAAPPPPPPTVGPVVEDPFILNRSQLSMGFQLGGGGATRGMPGGTGSPIIVLNVSRLNGPGRL